MSEFCRRQSSAVEIAAGRESCLGFGSKHLEGGFNKAISEVSEAPVELTSIELFSFLWLPCRQSLNLKAMD